MEALLELLRPGVEAQRDHLCPPVPRIDAASLTPLDFLRSFVGPSKPCILLNAVSAWPALRLWSTAHLRAAAGGAPCTLAVTPTGRADAVAAGGVFALPAEEALPLAAALDKLEGASPCCGVPYLSAQNDSLRREFPLLAGDVGAVRTASEAFGAAPDAVNLWVAAAPAGGRATPVSSTHCDHYENLMVVLRGEKSFTLLPPMDAALLYKREFPVARWAHDAAACSGAPGGRCWALRPCGGEGGARVPWIEADPDAPDAARFPLAAHTSPLRLTLRRGEALYLPALWLHQVGVGSGAREPTIAVNSWFDMQHGGVFAAQQMLLGLAPLLREHAAARGAAAAACAAAGEEGAPPLGGPLWRAFSARWRGGAPLSARDRAAGAADVAALHAAFGRPLALPLSLCGLAERVGVGARALANVYLPLLWWLREGAARAPEGRRYLLGVSGPAGSGKTTLAAALVALAAALPGFPAAAALSMDAYHHTNAWLRARGLAPRKGCIETIHGGAFAADLALAGLRGAALAAAAAAAGAGRPQPPPPPRGGGPPLEERPFWCELRACGTLALPRYDRAVTHDPQLGAEALAPGVAAVVVEGLFLSRGDGAHAQGGGADPVGGEAGAWVGVRRALSDVLALAPPLALCRARVLERRMRAAPANDAAAAAAHLAAAEAHYARADFPTFLELQRDAARASLVLRVALPEPLRRAAEGGGGGSGSDGDGEGDAAALAMPGAAALRALAEVAGAGGGAFEGLEVEMRSNRSTIFL